jgi:hypothetical protein
MQIPLQSIIPVPGDTSVVLNCAAARYERQKERALHQCEAALEEHKDRVKVMQEHLRNVQISFNNVHLTSQIIVSR